MKFANKSLGIILFFVLILWLQTNHFLEIGGITPNLLLIGFLILAFYLPEEVGTKLIGFIGAVLTGLSFIWFSFWVWGIIFIVFFAMIVNFIKHNLSGDIFVDYLFSIVISTLLFYIILAAAGLGVLQWSVIFGELAYNLILGEIILLIIKRI